MKRKIVSKRVCSNEQIIYRIHEEENGIIKTHEISKENLIIKIKNGERFYINESTTALNDVEFLPEF